MTEEKKSPEVEKAPEPPAPVVQPAEPQEPASDGPKTYVVLERVFHNRRNYEAGSEIELTDLEVAPLLKTGAVKIKAKAPAKAEAKAEAKAKK